MNRTQRSVFRVAVGAAALVLTSLGAAPARAVPLQVTHTRVDLFLPGIDQCGITVDSVVQGTLTEQDFVDSAGNVEVQQTSHVTSTLTNTANDKVVHVDNASRDAFTPDGVLNPDGTTTFTDTLTGMPVRVYTTHSDVLVKDVGYLSVVATVDADGNLLRQQVVEHGPHPFAGDFDVLCAAITAAIG
ncbi:MAG: hypothetical protein ACXVGH_07125 [Mycobacteriales bacterium]